MEKFSDKIVDPVMAFLDDARSLVASISVDDFFASMYKNCLDAYISKLSTQRIYELMKQINSKN